MDKYLQAVAALAEMEYPWGALDGTPKIEPAYVAIDGIPGLGKTNTLCCLKDIFDRTLLVDIIDSNFNENAQVFELCSKDPTSWAFTQQVYAANKMRHLHRSAECSEALVAVGVGGMRSVNVYTDFWLKRNNIDKFQHDILEENSFGFCWNDTILLKPQDLQACLDRIRTRNRGQQFPYSLADLNLLADLYDKSLGVPLATVHLEKHKHPLEVVFEVYEGIMIKVYEKASNYDNYTIRDNDILPDYYTLRKSCLVKFTEMCTKDGVQSTAWCQNLLSRESRLET